MRESRAINGLILLRLPLLVAAVLLLWFPSTTAADNDPPGRVARLNLTQGAVSFQPAGQTDWAEADPNRPLTVGDNLWADENSRCELHIGSTVIRLASHTGISFLNLNDQTVQLQLAQGSLNVRLRRLDEDEAFEVDTSNLAFSLRRPGEYRIDVDPNGTATVVTIRSGSGEVTGGESAYNLTTGQQASFSGTTPLTYDNHPAPGPDSFDKWCLLRDHREDEAPSARYVSRDVIGYEDLDTYGVWRRDPVYGAVWVPSGVAVGWAPYRYGHWVYIAPWGWTWVEDEPWGFAPFHYGRWAFVGGYWAWVPGGVAVVGGGPVVVRPVYAPHLVAFVGGGGFSVSVAIGGGVAGVAWVPLGPRDVWVPGYHASPRYVQNVNVSNTTVINKTQITNAYNNYSTANVKNTVNVNKVTYMNQGAPGAVTAVPQNTFANGQPVASHAVKVTPQQIQHMEVVQRTPVAPTPRAVVGPASTSSVRPPAALANRSVVTMREPAPHVTSFGHIQPVTGASRGVIGSPSSVGQSNKPAMRTPQTPTRSQSPTSAHQDATVSATPVGQPGRPATLSSRAPGKFQPSTRTNQKTNGDSKPATGKNSNSPAQSQKKNKQNQNPPKKEKKPEEPKRDRPERN